MKDPYPVHGRRWRLREPFRFVCRCGTNVYPCPAKRALDAARDELLRTDAASGWTMQFEDPLGHVRGRRFWSGGAR